MGVWFSPSIREGLTQVIRQGKEQAPSLAELSFKPSVRCFYFLLFFFEGYSFYCGPRGGRETGSRERTFLFDLQPLTSLAVQHWGIWIVFVKTLRSPVRFVKSNRWAEAHILCLLLPHRLYSTSLILLPDPYFCASLRCPGIWTS